MVTIRFCTTAYGPPRVVTVRTSKDTWAEQHIGGEYHGDSWHFKLTDDFYDQDAEFEFKFVLDFIHWKTDQNLKLNGSKVKLATFEEHQIHFDAGPDRRNDVLVENSWVRQQILRPEFDDSRVWDVVVIGSGMGGGIVAEALSDPLIVDGKNRTPKVLVLEAGGYLLPVHVANLPRQHHVGIFEKHVWHLWDELQVRDYTNTLNSKYRGGLGINFGGRSIFWGGLIPRMKPWEFEPWPREIAGELLEQGAHGNAYYDRAEAQMHMSPSPMTQYQERIKQLVEVAAPRFTFEAAPWAVQTVLPDNPAIATGMFSTADLLMESRLTDVDTNDPHLYINLNHRVSRIEAHDGKVTGVVANDLVADEERLFRAKRVILAAGSLESPMVIMRSGLQAASDKIGRGFTDHPVFYSHFALPRTSANAPQTEDGETGVTCKLVARHENGPLEPYNIILEIGADLLHGRYLDRSILEQQEAATAGALLCEIVFVCNVPLVETNRVTAPEGAQEWPTISMAPSTMENELAFINRLVDVRNQIVRALGGKLLEGDRINDEIVNQARIDAASGSLPESIPFCRARLGAAGHEAGTLRLGKQPDDVVDENLRFRGYDNLYVCDLSVFPSAPAANPSLTLAALALRLGDQIRAEIGGV